MWVGTEAVLHRVAAADVVAFLDFDAELYSPRYRAAEQALVLILRAGRLVGSRRGGGRILLQTFSPDHDVVRAAVLGDPNRLVGSEAERRRAMGFPPFAALAEVAGPGATDYVTSLDIPLGVELGGGPDHFLVRAPTPDTLADTLATGTRPPSTRLRIAVDPPRV